MGSGGWWVGLRRSQSVSGVSSWHGRPDPPTRQGSQRIQITSRSTRRDCVPRCRTNGTGMLPIRSARHGVAGSAKDTRRSTVIPAARQAVRCMSAPMCGMGMPWRPMCVGSRLVMVRHLVVPVRRAMPRRDQAPLIQSRLPAFFSKRKPCHRYQHPRLCHDQQVAFLRRSRCSRSTKSSPSSSCRPKTTT